jgi:hypothetical protein
MSYNRRYPYTHTKICKTTNESIEHIKWCRRNLGERGSDWDFAGSRNLSVMIYNEKYIPFYILIHE